MAPNKKTYVPTEQRVGDLTPEVLRDIARNESASWEWRKAAVKFLISKNHAYASHPDFSQILDEINEEKKAEQEVKDVVESATETPLEV